MISDQIKYENQREHSGKLTITINQFLWFFCSGIEPPINN